MSNKLAASLKEMAENRKRDIVWTELVNDVTEIKTVNKDLTESKLQGNEASRKEKLFGNQIAALIKRNNEIDNRITAVEV